MTDINLQPVTTVNFEAFTSAFNHAYHDYHVPIVMTVPSFQKLIARENIQLDASVAAVDGDQIVGMGMLGIRGNRAWIGGMGVIPERRRQGIGRRMMAYLLEQAREHDISEVWLEVIEANTGAHALYLEMGFEQLRFLHVVEREPDVATPPATEHIIEERPMAAVLAHYADFHSTPNCWQRDLASIQHLDLDGWAALNGSQVMAYAIGWADSHDIRVIDIGAMPGAGGMTAATDLVGHLHRAYPTAPGSAYNIADDDPLLAAFRQNGYTTTMRQIEMRYTWKNHE